MAHFFFFYNLDVGKPKQDSKWSIGKEKVNKFNPIKL